MSEAENKPRRGISISVQLEVPSPEVTATAKPNPVRPDPQSLEDRVREALECIESGRESHQDWILINKIYRAARNQKSSRAKNIVKMIKPVLAHYGYHDVTAAENQ